VRKNDRSRITNWLAAALLSSPGFRTNLIERVSLKFQANLSRERLQTLVILSSNYWFVRDLFRIVYVSVLIRVIALMRFAPEIRSLYLKIPKRRTSCFGSSDRDVLATTATLDWPATSALRDRLVDFLLPQGSWRRIVDLHVFTEPELDLKTLVESSTNGARCVRIFGSKKDFTRNSTSTGRVNALLYEYFQIGERVFARQHTAHEIRIVSRTILKIHEELVLRGMKVDCGERGEVLKRSAQLALGAGIRQTSFKDLASMFELASDELSEICSKSVMAGEDSCRARLHLTDAFARPITMDEFVFQCHLGLERLFSEFSDVIASALVGGTPGCDFDYRIYLILYDGTSSARLMAFFSALRDVFTSSNLSISELWRIRSPMVLTTSLWKKSSMWYHALRTLEEPYFLRRHGVVLAGQDLRGLPGEPSASDLFRSIAQSVCDLRNIMWESIRHRQTGRLADLLLGRIPVLWLILSKGTIATSRGEALSECAKLDFPNFDQLEELNHCAVSLAPKDLPPANSPIWEASLVQSCELIDSMVEMAQCRIS
jgi:hypothetical protein